MNDDQAKQLREAFPEKLIGTLPKAGKQLKFVGHAAVTDRLLQVDPEWTWEPMGYDARGLPALDEKGGLWIWLTIAGTRRPGYGEAGNNAPEKEVIGDAIRNAAMRFGVALDLWNEDLTPEDAVDLIDPNTLRNLRGAYLGLKSLVGDQEAQKYVTELLTPLGVSKFEELSKAQGEAALAAIEFHRVKMAEGVPA